MVTKNDTRKARMSTNKIASPKALIKNINKVVRALYHYRSAAMYKDISNLVNLHPVETSKALSSSRDLGLTKLAGKKGLYVLTEKGKDYARLIDVRNESESRKLLKQIILENPRWSMIVTFLRINRENPTDIIHLVTDVEKKLDKKWGSRMREMVARSYSSILEYAGLIRLEGTRITSLLEEVEKPTGPTVVPAEVSQIPAEKIEPLLPGFAEFKLENIYLRVRMDTDSIKLARDFLDVLDKRLKSLESKERALKP